MSILESLNLCLSYGCLRMCVYTSWQDFAMWCFQPKWQCQKNRVEILCKNPVRMPRDVLPRLDIIFWCISGLRRSAPLLGQRPSPLDPNNFHTGQCVAYDPEIAHLACGMRPGRSTGGTEMPRFVLHTCFR